ncbi:hypothetical protein FRC15_003269 [Serendipita sp. 397]|nr:hypothetical protein FRC15_003269 [Serendipita sp. 397]
MLSDNDVSSNASDEKEIYQLTINEHFAKAYKEKKEREELQKLKDKYGSDAELSAEESEDSETEDEDGDELTPAMDVAMLRTLAKIRSKDPTIYDSKKNVFEDEKDTVSNLRMKKTSKEKTKTLTIKQHALNSILDPNGSRTPSPAPLTYAKEQEMLKRETVQAFKSAVASGSEDSDEDGFLVPREKTRGEIEQEQEEYRAFLQREIGPNVDIKELITVDEGIERIHEAGEGDTTMPSKKKKKRKDSEQDRAKKEQSDQDFLANYILNRGWIDQSTRRLPTYDEVTRVKDSKEKHKNKKQKEGEHETASATLVEDTPSEGAQENMDDIDEEDDFDDLTERFESSYNFRFEEP